jgi:putative DNA primase/helicase
MMRKASDYKDKYLVIYSQYLPLKQVGKEYMALCPFHNDHNPSLSINPETGLFYCHGCGASGNVWQFLMRLKDITFQDAVSLTEPYGIVPENYSPNGHSSKTNKPEKATREEILEIIGLVEGKDKIAELRQEQKPKQSIVMDKFYPRPFTNEIMSEYSFWWEGGKNDFYYYDKQAGIWRDNAEDFIRNYFRTATDTIQDAQKRTYILNEIVNDVRDCSWKGRRLPEPKTTLIPFLNGVFDLDTGEFRNFREEDYFTWTLPHRYNPNAQCPFLYELINSLLPEEQVISLWELMGYCLWRSYPNAKMFFLFGRGSNGKTTFARILETMLGSDNVSHASLKDLQENRFAKAQLYRKLANIAGELEYAELKNTSVLKQLCGGDNIDIERKYKEPFKYRNYAKLIFLTNEINKTRDTTEAFYRRVYLIEFPKKFPNNPELDYRLLTLPEEEYEGLLLVVLDQLQKLLRRGFHFTLEPDDEEAKEIYNRLSSPLNQFIEENCLITFDRSDYIFKFEFLQRFKDWLSEKGRTAYTDSRLKQEMKELGLDEGRRGEKNYSCWVGISWKNKTNQEVETVILEKE